LLAARAPVFYNLAMIIDCHTHIFAPEVARRRQSYAAADPCFAALYASPRAALATAEDLIAAMDQGGIAVSVVLNIGWGCPELCRLSNDYIMEAVARYPGRLIGCGMVAPGDMEAAAGEIERCARGGLKGVGELRPEGPGFDWAGDTIEPVLAALSEHGMVLVSHASEPVGHIYPGKGEVSPGALYKLIQKVGGRFPVVLAHWGGGLPFYALMPEVKTALKDVYFDSAASPYLYRPEVYRQVMQLVGAEHVLFGSDYPLLTPGRLLAEIEGLALNAAEKDLLLAANARRIFGIK
jgi:predicted TIM-barrel fold metal-dependent hydrolase